MAPSKPSHSWNISSADQKNVALPDRFCCRECNKLKSPPQFSNKELNGYRWKKVMRIPVTNITAQLRCRNCTGEQTQELQCTGPCDLWKGLEEFSKNQRRRPDEAWCLCCTQWKEASEPGVTPVAAPNNVLSPDEEREVAEKETGFSPYSGLDVEGDGDSDDEGNGFIYNSMATMSIGDNGMPTSNEQRGETSRSHAASVGLPGYLTAFRVTSSISKTKSSTGNPYDNRSDYMSEGSKLLAQITENTPSDNAVKVKNQAYVSGTGWSTKHVNRPKPGIAYNAWDNSGQVHNQYRTLSQSTAVPGSTSTTGRAVNPPIPYSVAGGWTKNTTASNPPPQFPALRRPIKQTNYRDADDSPDEL